ncbi:DUF456 domain-containing protein [Vibrio sp. RE86]|uniref:hypothetical protein n=1 Tax=Vibrio sp. RE86 TaxID=2607605 RepID=UPI001493D3FF|nr:hypothetical protein [Vibrio sp. RE86]NOH82107.1 DUF456 domain-containing protein [Vibrio sp. RE86]
MNEIVGLLLLLGSAVWIIPFWMVCSIAAFVIAEKYGRTGIVWAGICLLTGILGLIVLLAFGRDEAGIKYKGLKSRRFRECPNCCEAVLRNARVCKHCHNELPELPHDEKYYFQKKKTYFDPSYPERECKGCSETIKKGTVNCFNCDTINEL